MGDVVGYDPEQSGLLTAPVLTLDEHGSPATCLVDSTTHRLTDCHPTTLQTDNPFTLADIAASLAVGCVFLIGLLLLAPWFKGTRMKLRIYNPQKLNTPLKRLGYLVLWVGVVWTLLSPALYYLFDSSPSWEYYWHYWDSHYLVYRLSPYCGPLLIVIGWLISYGYDSTIGRIVSWVKKGDDPGRLD